MFSKDMKKKNAILHTHWRNYVVLCIFPYMQFNFVARIIAILVYLALTNFPKFKRGQGQTSVMLLAIKFLKTISKGFFCQSSRVTLHSLTIFMGANLLIRIHKVVQKIILFGLWENAWFSWQPIMDSRIRMCLQIPHISAATYSSLLNFIPH